MSSNNIVLLLGSNLGDTKHNLLTALAKIEKRVGKIIFFSEMIESNAVEFVSNNIFRNIAIRLESCISPTSVLKLLKEIEVEMGRENDSFVTGNYTDRVIDIDIVSYNTICFQSKKLKIPHKKHLYERGFSKIVLEQLKKKIKTQI